MGTPKSIGLSSNPMTKGDPMTATVLQDDELDSVAAGVTQNDLDNGRLVCEVGVAISKPTKFAVLRVGRKTVDKHGSR